MIDNAAMKLQVPLSESSGLLWVPQSRHASRRLRVLVRLETGDIQLVSNTVPSIRECLLRTLKTLRSVAVCIDSGSIFQAGGNSQNFADRYNTGLAAASPWVGGARYVFTGVGY